MVLAILKRFSLKPSTGEKLAPVASQISVSPSTNSTAYSDGGGVVDRSCCLPFGTRTRFIVLFHLLLCLAAIWSNILTFNFAIICMIPTEHATGVHLPDGSNSPTAEEYSAQLSANNSLSNDSIADHDEGVVYYTPFQKTWLTSIVAVGALAVYIPVVVAINRLQTRLPFTILGLVSTAATALMPYAIMHNFGLLMFLRFCQGTAMASNFPVIGAFNSKWAYYKQNGLFVSVLVAYVQFAPAMTNLISGPLCEYVSWQSVFYVHAGHSAVVFSLFGLLFRNSPGKHPFVGGAEHEKISRRKSAISKKEARNIPSPFREIFTSIPVWAAWVGAIGNFFCVNLLFLYTSVYYSRVLGFSTADAGLTAAIPAIVEYFVKLFSGIISDRIHFISGINKLRIFNSLGEYGAAGSLLVLAFLDTEKMPTVCMILLMVATGILGCTAAGFFKSTQLISQQFSYIVTGILSVITAGTMLLVPPMVSGVAPENQPGQWRWVFVITAGVLVVANTIFCIFGSADPAQWTFDEYLRRNTVSSSQLSESPQPSPLSANNLFANGLLKAGEVARRPSTVKFENENVEEKVYDTRF